jgi:DNA-binding transcriptional MerR regulator
LGGIKMAYIKEVDLLDLLMTGEAARICGVDRRTFIAWADRLNILPAAKPQGRALYERKDVDRIAKRIRSEKEEREIK